MINTALSLLLSTLAGWNNGRRDLLGGIAEK
jgi:hypothetical protein